MSSTEIISMIGYLFSPIRNTEITSSWVYLTIYFPVSGKRMKTLKKNYVFTFSAEVVILNICYN